MNITSEYVKNYLFVAKGGAENSIDPIYRMCLEYVCSGKLVVLITLSCDTKLSPIIKELDIDKEQLTRFIIMRFSKINDITRKLIDLHDWNLFPDLIVLDLSSFILLHKNAMDCLRITLEVLMPTICQCIATLFNYMEVKQRTLAAQNSADNSMATIVHNSLFVLGEDAEWVTRKQIQLLINLYFYKNNAFDDITEMRNKILKCEKDDDGKS